MIHEGRICAVLNSIIYVLNLLRAVKSVLLKRIDLSTIVMFEAKDSRVVTPVAKGLA